MLIGPVEFSFQYLVGGHHAADFDCRAFASVHLGQPAYTHPGETQPTDPPTEDSVEDFSGIQVETYVRPTTKEEREAGAKMFIKSWEQPDDHLYGLILKHLETGAEDARFLDEYAEQLATDAALRGELRRTWVDAGGSA